MYAFYVTLSTRSRVEAAQFRERHRQPSQLPQQINNEKFFVWRSLEQRSLP